MSCLIGDKMGVKSSYMESTLVGVGLLELGIVQFTWHVSPRRGLYSSPYKSN